MILEYRTMDKVQNPNSPELQNELPQTLKSSVLRFFYQVTPLNFIDWTSLKFGIWLQFLTLQSQICSKRLSPLKP
jgi:hypothetical protein